MHTPLKRFVFVLSDLPSEIVEADVLIGDSEILSHFLNGLVHQRRPTEVQFDVFRRFVVIEVIVDNHLVDKPYETIAGSV